jgi:hypothetical protein
LPLFFLLACGRGWPARDSLGRKDFFNFLCVFLVFLHERRNKRNTHVFNWERATTKVTNDWILRQEHRPWSLVFLHPRSRCGTKSRPHCNHPLVFLPHPHTVLSRLATRARKRWKRNQWEDAIVSTRHFYISVTHIQFLARSSSFWSLKWIHPVEGRGEGCAFEFFGGSPSKIGEWLTLRWIQPDCLRPKLANLIRFREDRSLTPLSRESQTGSFLPISLFFRLAYSLFLSLGFAKLSPLMVSGGGGCGFGAQVAWW